MRTIGSYEAKTRLPELLRQVERGEKFSITRRGLPIARIVGVEKGVDDRRPAIERMKAARARRPAISIDELIAARKHQLTAYAAACLDLAVRVSAPVATLDRSLARAVREEGLQDIAA